MVDDNAVVIRVPKIWIWVVVGLAVILSIMAIGLSVYNVQKVGPLVRSERLAKEVLKAKVTQINEFWLNLSKNPEAAKGVDLSKHGITRKAAEGINKYLERLRSNRFRFADNAEFQIEFVSPSIIKADTAWVFALEKWYQPIISSSGSQLMSDRRYLAPNMYQFELMSGEWILVEIFTHSSE